MKSGASTAVGILVVAVAAASGGYWIGSKGTSHGNETSTTAPASDIGKKERKLLYYRNPMGLPDTSPTPKKDPMGMDYIPVYEGEDSEES